MRRRFARTAAVVLLAGAAALALVARWRSSGIGPVQRGFVVAGTRGCFGCHGPGGATGTADPAGVTGGVPSFSPDDVSSYAESPAEVREWILDGKPQRLRDEEEPASKSKPALLRMPAWRGVLSPREVDDLVAYVAAVSDMRVPEDAAAEAGRQAAARAGCFSCHGPQGRGNLPNPRSLKGYIPSWDGSDFPDLARDESEVREWILDGTPQRLREHPIAAVFLRRQMVQMPAFRGRLADGDVDAVLAYIRWLRSPAGAQKAS
jgi:mono/diheme cytochrome c family protein